MSNTRLSPAHTWDKVFPQSDKVTHDKITFRTTFGMELTADIYTPKNAMTALPALAISGPFGAVKEQSSGLYAQTLAEKGYLTLAFDPSFTGESSGLPRRVASPDINTEDFMAAIDFLTHHPHVDATRLGIIGICGWGGIALNAAATDPRIKATLASTMYDMTRITGNGYNDEYDDPRIRHNQRASIAAQRNVDYEAGCYARAGGVIDPLPDDAPQFVKDYHDYYKTSRGYHERSANSTDGWNITGTIAYGNARFMHYISEIDNAVMILHGELAHSLYFAESAYEALTSGIAPHNKEKVIIRGANHCDLYDGGHNGAIPWDTIDAFFRRHLAVGDA